MIPKEEIEELLPFRESQIGAHTDLLLVRDQITGACSQASCLYVTFQGNEYEVSCDHVLKPNADYFTGAKRLVNPRIDEGDSHGVPPIRLIGSSASMDLAVFDRSGLDLQKVPATSYDLDANPITFECAARNENVLSFIYGVAGFAAEGLQCPDGLVFVNAPIYTAHGPIKSVNEDLIVGDFAEAELVALNAKHFPKIADFKPTGGARHLGGMSGSGLWVHADERFHLAGVLLGADSEFDRTKEHLIRFTPVWRLKEWLKEVADG